MDKGPLVHFVVLNWNQGELTSECLASLAGQEYDNFQVIVVDNGSSDGSPARLRESFPWAIFIENEENVGYSLGNNVGIDYALAQGADYILLLNNDTEVDARMLGQLVAVAETDPQIGLVGPTMYYAEPPDMIWGSANRIDWRRARMDRQDKGQQVPIEALGQQPPRETDYIDTCAVLVRREVFEAIGPLDGNYFINFDDVDLNVRARQAGYKVVYVPAARMWHKVSAAMGLASPATTYYMTRNSLLFFWTRAPGLWKLLAPLTILLRTGRTVAAWTFKARYRSDDFRRRRAANLLAVRDFFLRRLGRMGPDVARACYGQ